MTAPEKRKPLTRAQFGQLMIDQDGRCACGCGQKLQPMTEGVIDEHVRALGLLGSNDLANRRLYRKPCARKKTDELDTPRMAKAKRQARETGPQRPGALKRKIPNRGFEGHRRFDGTIVRRSDAR